MTSTNVPAPEKTHLQVPAQTKNFLISPPGSPPIGWEPVAEEPPNTSSLAADLIAALTRVQELQEDDCSCLQRTSLPRRDGRQVLIDTGYSSSQHSLFPPPPSLITLEDVDAPFFGSHDDSVPDEVVEMLDPRHEMSSSRGSWTPIRSGYGRPPAEFSSITSVRATVDSMRTAIPPRSDN
jgi:hypothetical protein